MTVASSQAGPGSVRSLVHSACRARFTRPPAAADSKPASGPPRRTRTFAELGQTLDELFGRLEASFEAQRRFVANASHELRTPLAAGRTVLQVALADPAASSQTLRTACQEVIHLGDQQERLIDALLTLASSERGIDRWEPFDLVHDEGFR
jgi:signal transduction histidine kinase